MTNYDFYKIITSLFDESWSMQVLVRNGITNWDRANLLVSSTTVRPNKEELEQVKLIIHNRQTELALMNAEILAALGEMK